ncbi:MAG: LysE family translocator [Pseudomonadota bacterium]
MLDPDLFLAFLATAIVFAVMPGPALLYVGAQTLARGRRAGLMAVLGITVGGLLHVVAATLGLSAIFRLVPEAYLALKLIGALYLIWLGVQMIRGGGESASILPPAKSARRAFLESVAVEVLNPKTALFFIALLPQFTTPEAGLVLWAQFLLLGSICLALFALSDFVCVFFAERVMRHFRTNPRAGAAGRWIGGTVLGGLGVKLALEKS